MQRQLSQPQEQSFQTAEEIADQTLKFFKDNGVLEILKKKLEKEA
jgi:hypothetical protein